MRSRTAWTCSSLGVFAVADPGTVEEILEALARADRVVAAALVRVDAEGYSKYFLPDEVTVRFEPGVPPRLARQRIREIGCAVERRQRTPGYYTLRLPSPSDLFDVVRAFVDLPEVRFSEPSYVSWDEPLDAPGHDLGAFLWHLENRGERVGTSGADVSAAAAWELTRGHPDVVIAVIDTGVDLDHPDLAANLLPRDGEDWDFADPDDDVPDDEHGHGTACSGVAAAVGDNGIGGTGIAPDCRILPLRVDLTPGLNQNRADAIHYAASLRPRFRGMVISLSWRLSNGDFIAVHEAIAEARAQGCVVLAAAGNGDSDRIDYPARYEETIAVGATSPCDERKRSGSCDGETWWGSDHGPELDVVAPGVLIVTTDRAGEPGYARGDYAYGFNGTSAACPLAAGVCALMLSVRPDLDPEEVRDLLRATAADQVGDPAEDAPGWDPYMGAGRVDAHRAVSAALGERPHLRVTDVAVRREVAGDRDGALEPGEVAIVNARVANVGSATATGVRLRLSVEPTDPVGLWRSVVDLPDLPPGAEIRRLPTPFVVALGEGRACGVETRLRIEARCDGASFESEATLLAGERVPWRLDDVEAGERLWVHEAETGTDPWAIRASGVVRSPSHGWHAVDPSEALDAVLRSRRPIRLPASARLTFWQTFETDPRFDGALLEMSLDGEVEFFDLGPCILSGGYGNVIDSGSGG